jgi:hypothetical protein
MVFNISNVQLLIFYQVDGVVKGSQKASPGLKLTGKPIIQKLSKVLIQVEYPEAQKIIIRNPDGTTRNWKTDSKNDNES